MYIIFFLNVESTETLLLQLQVLIFDLYNVLHTKSETIFENEYT